MLIIDNRDLDNSWKFLICIIDRIFVVGLDSFVLVEFVKFGVGVE